MSFVWRMEADGGAVLNGIDSPVHSTQSDAENWIGEQWRTLADSGVAQVSLLRDGDVLYGPMSLSET